jgi:hypothetical protein
LVPGEPISKAYIAARDFIREKDERLAATLHSNFGFGVNNLNFNQNRLATE